MSWTSGWVSGDPIDWIEGSAEGEASVGEHHPLFEDVLNRPLKQVLEASGLVTTNNFFGFVPFLGTESVSWVTGDEQRVQILNGLAWDGDTQSVYYGNPSLPTAFRLGPKRLFYSTFPSGQQYDAYTSVEFLGDFTVQLTSWGQVAATLVFGASGGVLGDGSGADVGDPNNPKYPRSGQYLGAIYFDGFDESNQLFDTGVALTVEATDAWAAGHKAAHLRIWATAIGSTTKEYLRINGDTGVQVFNQTFVVKASDTALAGLRLPHGVAPSSPTNGDMWTTSAGLFVRINGVTKTVTLT